MRTARLFPDLLKKILILVHPENRDAMELAKSLLGACTDRGAQVYLLHKNFLTVYSSTKEKTTADQDTILEKTKLHHIVVLGGDGLFLKAVDIANRHSNVPISSVNFGGLGFLSDNTFSDCNSLIEEIYDLNEKMLSKIPLTSFNFLENGKKNRKECFLNEVYIGKNNKNETTYFTIHINGERLISWKADALIISTPIGSTAYSLSISGPIVWPDVKMLMLLPIHPHNILNRPLIISQDSKIVVEVKLIHDKVYLSCDGNREYFLSEDLKLSFFQENSYAKIVNRKSYSFEKRLRNRFLHEYM